MEVVQGDSGGVGKHAIGSAEVGLEVAEGSAKGLDGCVDGCGDGGRVLSRCVCMMVWVWYAVKVHYNNLPDPRRAAVQPVVRHLRQRGGAGRGQSGREREGGWLQGFP